MEKIESLSYDSLDHEEQKQIDFSIQPQHSHDILINNPLHDNSLNPHKPEPLTHFFSIPLHFPQLKRDITKLQVEKFFLYYQLFEFLRKKF